MIHYCFMTECKTWRQSARRVRRMNRVGWEHTFLNATCAISLDDEQIHSLPRLSDELGTCKRVDEELWWKLLITSLYRVELFRLVDLFQGLTERLLPCRFTGNVLNTREIDGHIPNRDNKETKLTDDWLVQVNFHRLVWIVDRLTDWQMPVKSNDKNKMCQPYLRNSNSALLLIKCYNLTIKINKGKITLVFQVASEKWGRSRLACKTNAQPSMTPVWVSWCFLVCPEQIQCTFRTLMHSQQLIPHDKYTQMRHQFNQWEGDFCFFFRIWQGEPVQLN